VDTLIILLSTSLCHIFYVFHYHRLVGTIEPHQPSSPNLQRNLILHPSRSLILSSMTGSHLLLRPATADEIHHIHDLNSASWAGDLDVETYHARERTLASTTLTGNGGILSWVLVNPADPDKILSSCETIKKDALISQPLIKQDSPSTVRAVAAHGVGSVFTPSDQRGNGYAGVMLRLLAETLKRGNPNGFNVLYSDIGKVG